MYRKLNKVFKVVPPLPPSSSHISKRTEIIPESKIISSTGIEGFLSIEAVDLLLKSRQMHLRSVAELEFGSGGSTLQAERELFRIIEKAERTDERMANPRLLHHASQAWNLEFFLWGLSSSKSPRSNETSPPEFLVKIIERDFGTWSSFQRTFQAHASAMIGCGWVWLVNSIGSNRLSIHTTFNGASPLFKSPSSSSSSANTTTVKCASSLSSVRNSPILGLNLWESAFILDYSLDRDRYVTNWWQAINWNRAAVLLSMNE